MEYVPTPLPTNGIRLSDDVAALTELLARNAHDHWALQRIGEGWTHGLERDDTAKKHPCLVPYEMLPESEKEYDRSTAMETLRAILALGYRIVPPADSL